MSTVQLGFAQGVELAHALVASAAERAGVAMVFIKGPVANHHGLRRPTVPSDVDVLVHPKDAGRLIAELIGLGWRRRPESRAHATFVTHSETLIHAEWPCDIDVHVEYPGFVRSASDVFAALSSHSVGVPIAGRLLPGASEIDSILISALHSLRAPYQSRSKTEYSELLAHVWGRGDRIAFLSAVTDRSSDLGASGALAPFLRDIDVPLPRAETAHLEPLWVLRAAALSRTAEWLNHILDAPHRDRPLILWQALVPSRSDLLIDHPSAAGRSLVGLRAKRIVKGVLAFPQAARALLRARRLRRVVEPTVERALDGAVSVASPSAGARASGEGAGAERSVPPGATRVVGVASIQDESDTSSASTETASRLRDGSSVVRSSQVAWAQAEDGIVVVDLASASPRPVALAGTSAFFWDLLAEPRSFGEMLDAASEAFGVAPTDIADDVHAFLVELETDGLILPT